MSSKTWLDSSPMVCALVKTCSAALALTTACFAACAIMVYVPVGSALVAAAVSLACLAWLRPFMVRQKLPALLQTGAYAGVTSYPVLAAMFYLDFADQFYEPSVLACNLPSALLGAMSGVLVANFVILMGITSEKTVKSVDLRAVARTSVLAVLAVACVAVLFSYVPFGAVLLVICVAVLPVLARDGLSRIAACLSGTRKDGVPARVTSGAPTAILFAAIPAALVLQSHDLDLGIFGQNLLVLVGAYAFPWAIYLVSKLVAFASRRAYRHFYVQCSEDPGLDSEQPEAEEGTILA